MSNLPRKREAETGGRPQENIMNLSGTLEWLYGLGKFGAGPGLHRISALLAELGNPHQDIPLIHVAGTNGKGSTCAYIASILRYAGYRVGLYTSPHLQHITERVRINGRTIDHDELVLALSHLRGFIERRVRAGEECPTFFETITAAMYLLVKEHRVDYLVQEVGLGGRFDATNAVSHPLCVAINDIDLDHTQVLGSTHAQIAREKAGIIKRGCPVAVIDMHPNALESIVRQGRALNAPLTLVAPAPLVAPGPRAGRAGLPTRAWFSVQDELPDRTRFNYHGADVDYRDLTIRLLGRHQVRNAALAVAACHLASQRVGGPRLPEWSVPAGLWSTAWPGRLEKAQSSPDVYLDGAHNAAGCRAMTQALRDIAGDRPMHLVFGLLRNKDAGRMLSELSALKPRTVTFTTCPGPGGLPVQELAGIGQRVWSGVSHGPVLHAYPDPVEAVHRTVQRAGARHVIVVCGSLYLVGAIRSLWFPADVSGREAALTGVPEQTEAFRSPKPAERPGHE